MEFDTNELEKLITTKMPYGKYKGMLLIDLPEPYVVWLKNNAMPQGSLADLLEQVYIIKVNGLESIFDPIRK